MSSVYPEVTAAYSRDRVLEKFDTTLNTLPYTLDDVKISHNDLLLAEVYNDTIRKLYSNYLFLIANAEITTKTSPTTALKSYNFTGAFTAPASSPGTTTSGTTSLSTINELHFLKRGNTNEKIVFSYGTDNSLIFKISENNQTITSLLSGNKVEFNKQFEFSNVVSVDSFNNFLFILDKGNNTLFKFDVSGLIYSDPPVERNSIDSDLPGRFLLKTIGGKGKVNRKNKLTNPSSISIFNEKIYVLDNGNFTIKIFDLNFNFINSYTDKEIFDYDLISINVSETSDLDSSGKIFILGKSGSIITCDTDFNNITVFDIFSNYTSRLDPAKIYNEKSNFKKIISSPSQKNILYVTTNKSIVKLYKTNLTIPISFYDNSVFSLNTNYEFIDSLDVDSISGVDNLVLFSHLSSGETRYSLFKDKNETNKLYHENFYTNYFSLSDITVKPQELVNAISFNKTTEKLLYNHSSFFENINKKIYSYYTDTRVPEICTVVESTYSVPSNFSVTSDFYIGVNEPLLTDVINRPIAKLYNQQEALFDILKEDFLNTNPPANIPEVLPSSVDIDDLPVIRFAVGTANPTPVVAGEFVSLTATRNKADRESDFKIYTTAGTGTLTSDYSHISTDDSPIYTFKYGETNINIDIGTTHFYGGANKSFTTSLYAPSGGIILQTEATRDVIINGTSNLYTVSLSTFNEPPVAVENGSPARFAVIRTSSDGTYTQDTSVNIFTSHVSTSDDDIVTISTDGTYKGSLDDFGNFPGFAPENNYQVFANTLSGGTVVFTENVSAVFFDVSAKADTLSELPQTFTVNISNPSQGSVISTTSPMGSINEELKSVSLTVDSTYPTNYNSTGKLSGVNIWYLLSADTTYKTYSAQKAVDVNLTITSPLTVYSPSADRGAIYFDAKDTIDPLRLGSKLTVNIPETSLVIGKGGAGGTGLLWLSGSNFDGTTSPQVSTVDDFEDSDYEHEGQDGGPVISLSGFNLLTINNSGSAIGGAGGGGAGFLAVSANPMPAISALSASSGGGGGAGISPNGFGIGGIKHPGGTFGALTIESAAFVNNGCSGSVDAGGAGGITSGTTDIYNTNNFNVMDGANGGNIGCAGCGGDQPDSVAGYPTCYDTVSSDVLRFEGGVVGNIVQPGVNWYTRDQDTTTGTFSGSDI